MLVTLPSALVVFVVVVVVVVGVADIGLVRLLVPANVALVVVVFCVVVGLPASSVPVVVVVRGGNETPFPFGQDTPFGAGDEPPITTTHGSFGSAVERSAKLVALPHPAAANIWGQLDGCDANAASICASVAGAVTEGSGLHALPLFTYPLTQLPIWPTPP